MPPPAARRRACRRPGSRITFSRPRSRTAASIAGRRLPSPWRTNATPVLAAVAQQGGRLDHLVEVVGLAHRAEVGAHELALDAPMSTRSDPGSTVGREHVEVGGVGDQRDVGAGDARGHDAVDHAGRERARSRPTRDRRAARASAPPAGRPGSAGRPSGSAPRARGRAPRTRAGRGAGAPPRSPGGHRQRRRGGEHDVRAWARAAAPRWRPRRSGRSRRSGARSPSRWRVRSRGGRRSPRARRCRRRRGGRASASAAVTIVTS